MNRDRWWTAFLIVLALAAVAWMIFRHGAMCQTGEKPCPGDRTYNAALERRGAQA